MINIIALKLGLYIINMIIYKVLLKSPPTASDCWFDSQWSAGSAMEWWRLESRSHRVCLGMPFGQKKWDKRYLKARQEVKWSDQP
jgi:hypothetical protein